MAIRFDAAGDIISKTTGLPSWATQTHMMWLRLAADRDTFGFIVIIQDSAAQLGILTLLSNGTTLGLYNNSTFSSGGTNLALANWYHIAMTYDGANLRSYVNGVLDDTHAWANAAETNTAMTVGTTSPTLWFDGRFAVHKVFNRVLTADQIKNEMHSYTPRGPNCVAMTPAFPGTNRNEDWIGPDWTVGGTLTDEDPPPVPWGRSTQIHPEHIFAREYYDRHLSASMHGAASA